MADVRPFQCIRPDQKTAAEVAALPYDVYSRKEAKEKVHGHPLSFLNIDRPETQYGDDFDMYSDKAYETARDMLEAEIRDGVFVCDPDEAYYIYEETMDGRVQTGITACCAIEDYRKNIIKKHENTLEEKEQDRIRHIRTTGAQTGPIFLAYRENERLSAILDEEKKNDCLYDFISDDGIRHHVWKISDAAHVAEIKQIFAGIESLYIADGHHRCASACKVGGTETFMAVLFADTQLKILPYNRAVRDLNGMTAEEFISAVSEKFTVAEAENAVSPDAHATFGMLLEGKWYCLTLKPEYERTDPVEVLDVSSLQDYLLGPVLGIENPRTDKRISFVGGIRGNGELEKMVGSGDYAVAFSMYPTQMNELLAVADAGRLMPPKSTWFEPKLRSGLFIHRI